MRKWTKRFSIALFLFFLALIVLCIPTHPVHAAEPPPERSLVVRVYYTGPAQLAELAAWLDIWETHPEQGYLLAMVSPHDLARLSAAGLRIEVDSIRSAELVSAVALDGIKNYPCYRTVEETLQAMQNLASAYPALATWHTIGSSWEKVQNPANGYPLNVLTLSNPAVPGPKGVFFLMAEIHAREYTTAETAARFAEYLLGQYGLDADITWLLDHNDIHILPMTNPDGRKFAEGGASWRKNTHLSECTDYGVDLNRNSSFQWAGPGSSTDPCNLTYRGESPASEPETQAVQQYAVQLFGTANQPSLGVPAPANTPYLFITLHSYAGLVLWPWGSTNFPAPNQAGLEMLGRKMAYFNGYNAMQSVGLYPTNGTTDDYVYATTGAASFTIEMGTSFFQSCSSFESTVYPKNRDTLLAALKAARRPYQTPFGPDVTNVTVAPNSAPMCSTLALSAAANGTRYKQTIPLSVPVSAMRYSLDAAAWQTGTATHPLTPVDGAFNSPLESGQAQIDTAGLTAGSHTVLVESSTGTSTWGAPTAAFFTLTDPGLSLQAEQPAQTGFGGGSIVYTLHLSDPHPSPGYTVTLSGGTWPASFPLTLAAGTPCQKQTFEVRVQVPADAAQGSHDTLTVRVAAADNPALWQETTLTSTAWKYVLYLPSMMKK